MVEADNFFNRLKIFVESFDEKRNSDYIAPKAPIALCMFYCLF